MIIHAENLILTLVSGYDASAVGMRLVEQRIVVLFRQTVLA